MPIVNHCKRSSYGKNSYKNIPDPLVRNSKILPIVPYRTRLEVTTATAANGVGAAVDFDLTFEKNQLMDIYCIEANYIPSDSDLSAVEVCNIYSGLFEDPDQANTTDRS